MHRVLQLRSFVLVVSVFTLLVGVCALPALASNIPIASTVVLENAASIKEGVVVIADEEQAVYAVSSKADDSRIYGVTAPRPPVFFSTGTNTVPIITEGVALVQVVGENGPIARGDLLVSASTSGTAMRAGVDNVHVFGIALEAYDGAGDAGYIQAEISVAKALAERDTREAASTKENPASDTSLFRGVVAAALVVGALFFVLYSFRSAIVQAVTSVGRNPRARGSIMTQSVASIVFALLLCALVVFIAIAILIVPV